MSSSKIGTKLFDGLGLLKGQWHMFSLALFASIIIMSLDFLLTISMPKIILGLQEIMQSKDAFNIPFSLFFLCLLIILRPLIAWIINYFQIKIILSILRKLESQIVYNSKEIFENNNESYSSEYSANMLISHGRYFVDAFLIPFIRAVTDLGTISVIAVGILIQYPLPLMFFLVSAFSTLSIYQILTKNLLRLNGEIVLRCFEEIMKSSKIGYEKNDAINNILNKKRNATIILGSISQGVKYVVEFSFMFSFGVATLVMFIYAPNQFVVFVATFAYAGIRMLPSFTSVISFLQTRSSAEQAIKELIKLLNPNKPLILQRN